MIKDRILYEDNHLIIVNKLPGDLTQGDETGDITLADEIKDYLKVTYNKQGNVYLGIPHRLDRPTSGIVVYAKTEKALTRLCDAFRLNDMKKTYWAVVDKMMPDEKGRLTHYLIRNSKNNKSQAFNAPKAGAKEAILEYEVIGKSKTYYLLEINLITGRHHQIRAQLAALNVHIKGDLKYGSPRSNPDGGIHLHSRKIEFTHPVKKEKMSVVANPPRDSVWDFFVTGK